MLPSNYLTIGPIPQNGTFVYSGTLVQQDGKTVIPAGSLLTLTLTITDVKTGVNINNQNQTDSLNKNGIIVDVTGVTGLLTWTPASADNSIVEANPNAVDGDIETHEAVLIWTWTSTDGRTLQSQRKIFITIEKYASTENPIQPGNGGSQVTINLGQPGVQVWITTDALGHTRVGGTLITDFRGLATFQLTNGAQYYLWTAGGGFVPILGQLFTAVADIKL